MSLTFGTDFAGYTIERLLGSGGMGEVYLARHPRLPRRDALKILRADVSADAEFRMRFVREAEIAAALTHPSIVSVYDTGECDGQLWIATEYVDGTDAAQMLRTRYPGGMPLEEASAVVTAIASALDYAHDQGLLHRDVKPANILLSKPDRDGRRHVYLADFGIARPLVDPNGLTATNLTVGTVAYAAPEQLMGEELDGRADEYALAATAFHLLTGTQLYSDSNPVAVISRHLQAPAPALSERRPDLASLDGAFRRALAKDPAQRFDSCGGFANALTEQAGPGSSESATESALAIAQTTVREHDASAPVRSRHWPTRRTSLVVLAAALTVGGAVGAGIHLNQKKSAPVAQPAFEGVYRIVYDNANMTANGLPAKVPGAEQSVTWWAYRSHCASDGCVATGTALDLKDPTIAKTPPDSVVRNLIDGSWTVTGEPKRVDEANCLSPAGNLGPGSNLSVATNSARPQADGTLKGAISVVILTNECGLQGSLYQTPFVATRTDALPARVDVRDPAQIPVTVPASSPPQPDAPVLDGIYRIDKSHQLKQNGVPTNGDAGAIEWWAFRTSCTSEGCVATGQLLSDVNHQRPAGAAMVLKYKNGIWNQPPGPLADPLPCANWGSALATKSLSLTPQPDGTLRGMTKVEVVGGDCSGKDVKGTVYTADATATRVADVPPTIVLADPALFH